MKYVTLLRSFPCPGRVAPGLRAGGRACTITAMVVRAAMVVVLCLGLGACTLESKPSSSVPAAATGWSAPAGWAEATGDFIVVRETGAVSVLARVDGKPLWSVPQRASDPIAKARLAQGAIVVVRKSQTAE